MKKVSRKISFRRFAAAAAAVIFAVSSAVSVSAAGTGRDRLISLINENDRYYDWYIRNVMLYEPVFGNMYDYTADEPQIDRKELPASYDLRNVNGRNYVSPVKYQRLFKNCWSYAVCAAAETSIATADDFDFNTASKKELEKMDLSERHLSWFLFQQVGEDDEFYSSQAGEGYHLKFRDDENIGDAQKSRMTMDISAWLHGAAGLFSAGIGPALETDVPFRNNENAWRCSLYTVTFGRTIDDYDSRVVIDDVYKDTTKFWKTVEQYKKKYADFHDVYYRKIMPKPYTTYYFANADMNCGDWSVDNKYKYTDRVLKNANLLPSPTNYNNDFEYKYNELGTYAIKKEITEGRAVMVGFCSQQTTPGQQIDPDNTFLCFTEKDGSRSDDIKADFWAHFSYDKDYDPVDPYSINHVVSADHAVVIVGYDDNFPKERFNDPKGLIPADGAFIAKNSWGTEDTGYYWGNGGDGFFYISYYDQSLSVPESFEFMADKDADTGDMKINMYDTLSLQYVDDTLYSKKYVFYTSNVFTADEDETIRYIGVSTGSPNCSVKYAVYLLDDDHTGPTDGKKVTSSQTTPDYAGYHMIKLNKPVDVKKGQKYSIVVKQKDEDGNNIVQIKYCVNRDGDEYYCDMYRNEYINTYGTADGCYESPMYTVAVVNPGESYIGIKTKKGVEWYDWSSMIKSLKKKTKKLNNSGFDYDNFCIRSYTFAG